MGGVNEVMRFQLSNVDQARAPHRLVLGHDVFVHCELIEFNRIAVIIDDDRSGRLLSKSVAQTAVFGLGL